MRLQDNIEVFEKLGMFMQQFGSPGNPEPGNSWLKDLNNQFSEAIESIIQSSHVHNPWFTEENMRFAMKTTGNLLNAENLSTWLKPYDNPVTDKNRSTVAVIMAGNIPLVGFHDMLCVLASGHNLLAKLSVKDDQLLKVIAEVLYSLDDHYDGKIAFEGGRLRDFDAVIATGSNNTSRYFEYYFNKYPSIIRKNRVSAAVLDGSETKEELLLLSDDVFRYFGLGCRSISKVYVPLNFDLKVMVEAFNSYSYYADHSHWANNYDYQKAIHLIDQIPHMDTGYMIIRETDATVSPIAVLNYEKIKSPDSAIELLRQDSGSIQCIVGKRHISEDLVPFGMAQNPGLSEYADNIDTLDFLLNLKS